MAFIHMIFSNNGYVMSLHVLSASRSVHLRAQRMYNLFLTGVGYPLNVFCTSDLGL